MDDSMDNFTESKVRVKRRFPRQNENKRNKLSRANKKLSPNFNSKPLKPQNGTDSIDCDKSEKSSNASLKAVSKYFSTSECSTEETNSSENGHRSSEDIQRDLSDICSGDTKKTVYDKKDTIQFCVSNLNVVEFEQQMFSKVLDVAITDADFKVDEKLTFTNIQEPKQNDKTVDCTKSEMQEKEFISVTNTLEHENMKDEAQTFKCPVCYKSFEEASLTTHIRSCFANKFERTANSESCGICLKDISHMNPARRAQHVNRCLDLQCSTDCQPPDPKFLCPICGVSLKTEDQRFGHLKRCGKKFGIEPHKIVEATKLLEKQLIERKALGLPIVPIHASKRSPKKKQFAAAPRSNADAEMQMALAISASLEKESECDLMPLTTKRKGRIKNSRLPDCLQPLFLQTETERQKILEQKVAALIFPQVENEVSFECAPANKMCMLDENHFWTKTCILESDNFYVPCLKDFITPKAAKNNGQSYVKMHKSESKELVTSCVESTTDTDSNFTEIKVDSSEKAGGFQTKNREEAEGNARSLSSDMKKLVGSHHLSDLSIRTAECEIPAHKLVLSLRCPEILNQDISTSELDWSDIPSTIALAFLECIYTGEFNEGNVLDQKHQILKLAHKYRVQDLFQSTVPDAEESEEIKPHEESHDDVLGDDDIEEICQYSQSQRLLPNKEDKRTSSSLDNEIINQLLDGEDVLEGCSYTSERVGDQLESDELIDHFCRASSPELFASDSESELENKNCSSPSSDITLKQNVSLLPSRALRTDSSSPVKASPKKVDIRVLSPKKQMHQSQDVLTIDSSEDENEEKILSSSFMPLEREHTSINETMVHSPISKVSFHYDSKIKLESSLDNKHRKLTLSPISRSEHQFLQSSLKYGEIKSPTVEERKFATSIKNDRKRSLDDLTWKTPKREKLTNRRSLSPLENYRFDDLGVDHDPEIWDAFEDECCIEMVETPKTRANEKSNISLCEKESPKKDCIKTQELQEVVSTSQKHAVLVSAESSELQKIFTPKVKFSFTQQPIAKTYNQVTPKSKFSLTQQPGIKICDQVTPLPNYKQMITPELKEALKSYGVRKLPRSKAVILLNHIYELTHPLVDEDLGTKKGSCATKSPGEKIRSGPSKLSKSNKESDSKPQFPKQKGRSKKLTSTKPTRQRIKKTKAAIEHKHETEELSSSQNSSSGEMLEESMGEIISTDDDLKKAIKKFIIADRELHDKILLYEPISVHELHQNLKENKLAVAMPQLMNFLDEECITFSLPRGENYRKKQQDRTKRFCKRVLSQIAKDSA